MPAMRRQLAVGVRRTASSFVRLPACLVFASTVLATRGSPAPVAPSPSERSNEGPSDRALAEGPLQDLVEVAELAVEGKAPAPYETWHISLDHSQGSQFGFSVTSEYNSLYVNTLEGAGLVQAWNEENLAMAVRIGDRFVSVNGRGGPSAKLLEECDKLQRLDLIVLRVPEGPLLAPRAPVFFEIFVDRTTGKELGVRLLPGKDSLLISHISVRHPGSLGEWNSEDNGFDVGLGDRIVSINGVEGNADVLRAECFKKEVLEMKLLKAPPSPPTTPAPPPTPSPPPTTTTPTTTSPPPTTTTTQPTTTTTTTEPTTTTKKPTTTTTTETTTTTTAEPTSTTTTTTEATTTTTRKTTTSTTRPRPTTPMGRRTTTTATTAPPRPSTTWAPFPSPTPRTLPGNFVQGLKAEFWYHIDNEIHTTPIVITMDSLHRVMLRKPDLVRLDQQVNYPPTTLGWRGMQPTTYFAARWSGELHITTAGWYLFQLQSDDGSALFIDGVPVVGRTEHPDYDQHNWEAEPAHEVMLGPGLHAIRIEYFNTLGVAGIVASYAGPDTHRSLVEIPSDVLQTASSGVPQAGLDEQHFMRKFATDARAWPRGLPSNVSTSLVAVLLVGSVAYGVSLLCTKVRRRWVRRTNYDSLQGLVEEGEASAPPAGEC